MSSTNAEFLKKWHDIVANRDLDGLREILADDVSLGAPPYWDKLEGKSVVHQLLSLIIQTIEDFTYHREWHQDSHNNGEIALEFRGHLGELLLQGIDLISLNERGELQNLDVMIRPANALTGLRDIIAPQMLEFLQGQNETAQ